MKVVVPVLIVLCFVLVACSHSVLKARPLNASVPDPCEGIDCSVGMQCAGGRCVCAAGTKACGERCIGLQSCCTDSDCSNGYCEKNSCVALPECGYNSAWSREYGECACIDGTKFCEKQGKCIPVKNCCGNDECDSDQRCAPTTYSAAVCMMYGTKKCHVLHEGSRAQEYVFPQARFSVRLADVLEGGRMHLLVDKKDVRISRPYELVQILTNATLYLEELQVFGGNCREEPD